MATPKRIQKDGTKYVESIYNPPRTATKKRRKKSRGGRRYTDKADDTWPVSNINATDNGTDFGTEG